MSHWTEDQKSTLEQCYGNVETEKLAETLGVTAGSLRRQASRMGLSEPWPTRLEPYREGDSYAIPLCSRKHFNKVAYVDADQYGLVKGHRWHVVLGNCGVYYARTNIECRPRGMHQFLLEVPEGMVVDHIDGDGLNNRSANLRPATTKQNIANSHHDDRLKGVIKQRSRWIARARGEYLGSFKTPEEAALAYDKAAAELWGEYACLNYPDRQGSVDEYVRQALNAT